MIKVVLKLTNNERADILFALKLWVKNYGHNMRDTSKFELEQLIEKVDCAGIEEE